MEPVRKRVLHVYKDYYPPVMGGVEMTINLLAKVTKPYFDVSVLVCCGNGSPGEEMIDGVRVIKVPEYGRPAGAPISPGMGAVLRREAKKADIIHLHHPNPTGDLAHFLSRTKKPTVMTYHSDVVRQKSLMKVYGPLQKRTMKSCDVIMPTSPNYMESSEWLQKFKDKCVPVPLGINTQRFAKTPEVEVRVAELKKLYPGKLVIFVGRLRYYKGLQFLLDAMRDVKGSLLLIGTGKEEINLSNQALRLQLGRQIRFLGELSDDEVVAHLHTADVFCMPSHLRSEAFGLSQIEAMSCGLPVVSTNIKTGVPYVNQDGVTGITVDPGDPFQLATALNKLLKDDDLRMRMGAAAYERAVSLFDYRVMGENVMKVYNAVLNRKK